MYRRLVGFGFALALVVSAAQLPAQDITIGIKGGIIIADLAVDDPTDPTDLDTRTAFAVGLTCPHERYHRLS